MSEQRDEVTKAESSGNAPDAGPTVPEASATVPAEASAGATESVDAPALAPEHAASDAAPEPAQPTGANPKADKSGSRTVTIMSPGPRSWDKESWADGEFAAEPDAEPATKPGLVGTRRLSAIAAMIVLSAVAGAVGGALATAGLSHFGGDNTSSIQAKVQDEQIQRLESEVAALKSNVEHTAKLSVTQISKTADRLDRIEKAQAEPAAKIAKLAETVDKLRAAPAPAPTPVAAAPAPAPKDVTGSIPTPAPKPEVARLPTVEGWVLRDVADGGAVIEGRSGVYEVYAGDPVPGLGRVDAIRRQDGRWVVVTSRGLIVAR